MPLQEILPQRGWALRRFLPQARCSLTGSIPGRQGVMRQSLSGARAGSAGSRGTSPVQALSHAEKVAQHARLERARLPGGGQAWLPCMERSRLSTRAGFLGLCPPPQSGRRPQQC